MHVEKRRGQDIDKHCELIAKHPQSQFISRGGGIRLLLVQYNILVAMHRTACKMIAQASLFIFERINSGSFGHTSIYWSAITRYDNGGNKIPVDRASYMIGRRDERYGKKVQTINACGLAEACFCST